MPYRVGYSLKKTFGKYTIDTILNHQFGNLHKTGIIKHSVWQIVNISFSSWKDLTHERIAMIIRHRTQMKITTSTVDYTFSPYGFIGHNRAIATYIYKYLT